MRRRHGHALGVMAVDDGDRHCNRAVREKNGLASLELVSVALLMTRLSPVGKSCRRWISIRGSCSLFSSGSQRSRCRA